MIESYKRMGYNVENETLYEYKDFLEKGIKFTAYREKNLGHSTVHKHNFLELIYILSGNAVHYIDGIAYNVTKGDLLLIDTNETHYHYSETGVTYADMVLLPDFISESLHSSHTALDLFAFYIYNKNDVDKDEQKLRAPLVRFRGNELIESDGIVNAICNEIEQKQKNYIEIVSNYLNILLYMMVRNIESNETVIMNDIRDVIPGIIDYIEKNSDQNITLSDMATKYFYSPSYFSRAFKKYFGKTFSSYLQSVRIEKVIQLMQDPSLSIDEISMKTGYNNKRELYRAFKNITGTTPSNYKKTKMQ